MAISTGLALAAAGTAVGGLASASAAKKGAQAQTEAVREANETQRYIYDQNVKLSEPWRRTGVNALSALAFENGIGPRPRATRAPNYKIRERVTPGTPGTPGRPAQGGNTFVPLPTSVAWERGAMGPPTAYYPGVNGSPTAGTPAKTEYFVGDRAFDSRDAAQGWIDEQTAGQPTADYSGNLFENFETSPGYQFRLGEGEKAIERGAAARGLNLSGATLKDLMRFNQGTASSEYGRWYARESDAYNRLAGLAGAGQVAASNQQTAGTNFAGAVGNNLMQMGRARASGYQGQANALNGAINNGFSIYGAAQGGMFGPNPGFGIKPFGVT